MVTATGAACFSTFVHKLHGMTPSQHRPQKCFLAVVKADGGTKYTHCCRVVSRRNANRTILDNRGNGRIVCLLFRWCFEPSQPQRITSGLNTNFTLPPSCSFQKSSHHKSCFFSLILHGHSTWEPASSRVTYLILQAHTGTGVSHSQRRKNQERFWKKMKVNGLEGQK